MNRSLVYIFFSLALYGGCDKKGGRHPVPGSLSKISIGDVTLIEGNGGTTNYNFRVYHDVAATAASSVSYSISDGSARAKEDYSGPTSGTLYFAAGEREKNIVVTVLADDVREGDEDFTVLLSNPVGAALSKTTGVGTIRNDDVRVPFTNAGYDAPIAYAGYNLAWSDEFNGPELDNRAWSYQNGDGCPNLCGWGNNELQFYKGASNTTFQDGKMIIEARKESRGSRNYTSAKIVSSGKKTIKFGRIDIRAKLPKGKGIWPALWLLPQHNVYGGWPRSGEIDLMELVGHEPGKVYGTLHFGPGPGSTQISRSHTLPSGSFNDEFHVFSLEWKQDQVKWYVDGNLFSTVNKSDFGTTAYPFNEEFYFIINLAVGGNWPGSPDATTFLPQWLIVDYVRVYQQ
jgi:beta-glucanase (GH16 family)